MPDNQRLVELFQYDPANPAGPYRIFPVGEFTRDGKKFAITDEMCAEFAANFAANVLGRDVVTNIEHIAEEGAVGWIKALVHKAGDGLYAAIAWTDKGLQFLREQAFRYFSPEVAWRDYEAKDGKKYNHVITGLAVTNYPYFGAQTAMFSEKAAQGAEVWMQDKTAEQFMYESMPMYSGDNHNLLSMLEQISFLLKCLEKADEPNADMIERVAAVKDALKEAVRYIVDEYADAEPAEEYATKREQGEDWEMSAFLHHPDPDKPSEWKLRIKEVVDGKKTVTKAQLGRAAAALGKGFRGNRVQLSAEDRASAVRKLKAEYRKMGVADEDMPRMMSDSSRGENTPARGWLARLLGALNDEPEEIISMEDKMADKQKPDVGQPVVGATPPVTPTLTPDVKPEPKPEPKAVTAEQFAEMQAQMEARFGKMVGDLRAALDAKAGEVERFKEQFTAEQTARRKQQFTETAREQFSALSGTADELGARLMWAFDSDTTAEKDHYTWFTGQLAAANAIVAQNFREVGHTQPRTDANDAFSVRLGQKRDALKQANPKMSDAEAYGQALDAASSEDPQGAARWFEKNG